MTKLPQFLSAFTILTVLSAKSVGITLSGRTRPLPDTMDAHHRLSFQKTSKWIHQSDDTGDVAVDRAELLAEKRKALIKDLERVLRSRATDSQRLEVNLRLGRLYFEEYYARLDQCHQSYSKALQQYEKDQKGKRPELNTTRAKGALNRARAFYSDLLTRYTTSDRRDEMLYFFALSSLDKHLEEEAVKTFHQLAETYPKSKYAGDALAQAGDHYFLKHKLERAESYYDKIVQRRLQALIPYAIYKKAWCAYNRGNTQLALRHFHWVIENENPAPGTLSLKIRNEALADITLPFTDLKLVNKSITFFKGFEDAIYRKGLESMAWLYFERGGHDQAAQMWDDLLDSNDAHPRNPEYEANIVEATMLKNDPEGAISRLFDRVKLYLSGSVWHDKNKSNGEIIEKGAKTLEGVFRKHALRFHDTAQRMNQVALYELAKRLYLGHIEFFPSSDETTNVRFHLAKVLYKQAAYKDAAEQYSLVYHDAKAPVARRQEAIEQALAALSNHLNQENKTNGFQKPNAKRANAKLIDTNNQLIPYTPTEEMFLSLSLSFQTSYPKHKDLPDALYEMGYLHYWHRDFDKAYPLFQDVALSYSAHPTAPSAGHLLLDILNRDEDFPALIEAAQELLKDGPKSAPFRADVQDILRRAELKIVERLEHHEKYAEAAAGYLRYCKMYGPQNDALHEKALYNGSINLAKAGQHMTARETLEKFQRLFPGSKLRSQVRLQIAQSYEATAEFKKAATHYADFAANDSQDPQARNALRLAGLYYWGGGDLARAEKTMASYLETYPTDANVQKDRLSLYEFEGRNDKLRSYHRSALTIKRNSPLENVAHQVALAELQHNRSGAAAKKLMRQAAETAKKHTRALKKSHRGVELLAKISFWEISEKEKDFYRIRLNRLSSMEANLAEKLKRIKDLEKNYALVAKLGSEEFGLAAIYRTGAAYHHLATTALHAPVPRKLSGKNLEAYQAQLKKTLVTPFQEKAAAMVEKCLEKSHELHLFSRWTAKCYSMGAEIAPEKYLRTRTLYVPSIFTSVLAPNSSETLVNTGSTPEFPLPYLTSPLFSETALRGLALMKPSPYDIGGEALDDLPTKQGMEPIQFDYEFLAAQRTKSLEAAQASQAPSSGDTPSFAYLNLLRATKPAEAIMAIRQALQRAPGNAALYNLMGLAQLDAGSWSAAQVTWMAMLARGQKSAAVLNNLGVLATLVGQESKAVDYFKEARELENSSDAAINLGLLALKYHNGLEAMDYFERARVESEQAISNIGFLVAQIQSGDIEGIRGNLESLTRRYKSDPFARLAVSFFLIDVEKDNDLAVDILTEFLDENNLQDASSQFQRALQEAKKGVSDEVANLSP